MYRHKLQTPVQMPRSARPGQLFVPAVTRIVNGVAGRFVSQDDLCNVDANFECEGEQQGHTVTYIGCAWQLGLTRLLSRFCCRCRVAIYIGRFNLTDVLYERMSTAVLGLSKSLPTRD